VGAVSAFRLSMGHNKNLFRPRRGDPTASTSICPSKTTQKARARQDSRAQRSVSHCLPPKQVRELQRSGRVRRGRRERGRGGGGAGAGLLIFEVLVNLDLGARLEEGHKGVPRLGALVEVDDAL